MTGGARHALSVGILQPAYRAYRLATPRHRRAVRAFWHGLSFRRSASDWSAERRQEWVLARLRAVVREAYQGSRYYRALLDGAGVHPDGRLTFDDFARIPPLEREDLHRAGASLRSDRLPAHTLRRDATGGSTGMPVEVWRGPEELGWNESGPEYFMRRLGVPQGAAIGLLWGHHLDPVASDRLQDRLRYFVENVRWFDCFRISPEVLQRYHRELQNWRPRCVVAYAGALGALAEWVLEHGDTPGYPTHCFVTGAEKLLTHHREAIERAYRRPVFERYGSRDVGLIAFQAAADPSHGFEVDWANVLVEPATDGDRADVLVTKLHADGMPMLRYRVGDLARFSAGDRPGYPAFRLREVIGRALDRVWLPDGRWVHGIEYPHLMKDFPVRQFQIVQAADLSVTVRLVPRDDFSPEHERAILHCIRANLPGLPVRAQVVQNIPRTQSNKWRPVISEVVQPPAPTGAQTG